jgi:hypothetical protein
MLLRQKTPSVTSGLKRRRSFPQNQRPMLGWRKWNRLNGIMWEFFLLFTSPSKNNNHFKKWVSLQPYEDNSSVVVNHTVNVALNEVSVQERSAKSSEFPLCPGLYAFSDCIKVSSVVKILLLVFAPPWVSTYWLLHKTRFFLIQSLAAFANKRRV